MNTVSPWLYELRVSGYLSEHARSAFGDYGYLGIVPAPPETIIYATVVDEAHLQGILGQLADLGLRVVSMHQMPEAPE